MSKPQPLRNPDNIRLYSARVCPFVQRVRLTLLEKGLEFESVDIDLDHIPDWYEQLTPEGKVPLLEHDGDVVWESNIINEYLEDLYPQPALLPEEPGARARTRLWIDYTASHFLPPFYQLLLAQEADRRKEQAAELDAAMGHMEQSLATQRGPYWMGEQLTLADVAIYPFFERLPVLTHYRDYHIPEKCHRLRQWLAAMESRASVQATRNPLDYYVDAYAGYASGSVRGA